MAVASAKVLLDEFAPWVRRYNIGAAVLGVALGAWDGPQKSKNGIAPLAFSNTSSAKNAETSAEDSAGDSEKTNFQRALEAVKKHPPELGFFRQFVLTTPGIILALKLGGRAQAMQAPPAALLLASVPSLSCPLLVYVLGGYPAGVFLRGWLERTS
eukprot:TRINITY_DN98527_c0_g1_i1.p1 TRINITY_DN98527_c0_g1~~TRINITY_DN98527_c0_g1_i1.p1  ORF type:complete len:156 (-),score=35.02 TRINITY_DN98527_c0_g1_i1:89-556(-)